MFRRWRRRTRNAAEAVSPSGRTTERATEADLRGEHIFELVNQKLAEFIGHNGGGAPPRRTAGESDRIFDAVVTHQIAAEVTRAILHERESVAVVVPQGEEAMALSWTPAPLVVWAEPVREESAEFDAAPLPTIGHIEYETRAAA